MEAGGLLCAAGAGLRKHRDRRRLVQLLQLGLLACHAAAGLVLVAHGDTGGWHILGFVLVSQPLGLPCQHTPLATPLAWVLGTRALRARILLACLVQDDD